MVHEVQSIFAQGGGPKVRQLRQYLDQRLLGLRIVGGPGGSTGGNLVASSRRAEGAI